MAPDLHFRCFYAGNYREAYWERNDHTAHRGTGEIRLDTGVTGSEGAAFGCSGNGKTYKRDT
jgi:hypothetical protein